MSNLMHKVKDAMAGHHDSSTTPNKQHGTHGTTATRHDGTSNYNPSSMGSTNYQAGQYPTAPHDPSMDMGIGAQGTGTQFNPQHEHATLGSNAHDTGMSGVHSGDPAIGSNIHGSDWGTHDSGNINAGPHQSKLANKLDPRVDSDLDNRGAHAGTTTSTTGPTGTYGATYGGPGGANLNSGSHGYNTRSSNTDPPSHMANPTGQPTGAPFDNRTHEPGFGGAATGGSSYNAPGSTQKQTPGPHHSSLLNKLDPRVHSTHHEHTSTAGNQRGV
ncbi:hypothetical protein N7492_008870 [Penicillium capsulatum]|uniref:Cell surface protein n=1 Tax=Penicillium capsulatum TaxID=69766 RepID=A0A9W9HST1_9EURO|nr:hypothetical protein N7492_008870 [Penicillium capsulatum]KAJ6106272.1 hypothetical protein N7512_009789 [Penicillium capsulatum]